MIINGVKCTTIEEVEIQIAELSEDQKQLIRNDFNGVPNEAIEELVPQIVTARQMKKALAITGKLAMIEAYINSMAEPNKTLVGIEFRESNEFQRNNVILNQMAPLLGLNNEQVDELFILAATL
jgi:hypothetical protein